MSTFESGTKIQLVLPPWQKQPQLSWRCVSLRAGLCSSRRCVRTPSPPECPRGSGRWRGNAEVWEAEGIRNQQETLIHYISGHVIEIQSNNTELRTLPLTCQNPIVGPWTWQSAQRRTRRTETRGDQSKIIFVPIFISLLQHENKASNTIFCLGELFFLLGSGINIYKFLFWKTWGSIWDKRGWRRWKVRDEPWGHS